MTAKRKEIFIVASVFLLTITTLIFFMVKEKNIVDFTYLVFIIFYFVKFLIIQRWS